MLDFLRGQKESIRRLCGGLELELEFYHKAPLEIDVGCFGLDDAGKLSDERYFIFYNQTQSPRATFSYTGELPPARSVSICAWINCRPILPSCLLPPPSTGPAPCRS